MYKLFKLLIILIMFPMSAFAQTNPCYWLYSVPYVESPEDERARELSIAQYTDELKALGIVKYFAFEVGGNRAVTCMIGARIFEPRTTQLKDLLHGVAAATKIPESHARDLFNAPWYQVGWDDATQDMILFDGRDGRELLTHASNATRLYQLYDAARRWTTKCGHRLPLPAGC